MRLTRTNNIDNLLIFLIVAIGALLRFYDYGNLPFTYDEFSALFRTRFSSFNELISKGVIIDAHPAGVQVFLYYWVGLTGFSAPLVKLPFTILSLASVYLIYSIGRRWFSSTAGLIAACFLSFLQYPVMYGQIARPYASGLFLVLLMVHFWTNLILRPEKKYYANLAGYIIASALCAYNHHFTLLFCGIAGLTGAFIIDRSRLRTYLVSWGIIFLLYTPHLTIFFRQLGHGGIGGWLSKPRPDFLPDYLSYVFQFSWYVFALVVLLIILSLVWRQKGKKTDTRLALIAFSWFLIPILAGFIYSYLIDPVLQYSVLLFSFPFLLLLIFCFADAEKAWKKVILTGLCALVVIPSLVIERKHYKLFYESPYKEILTGSKKAAEELGRPACYIFIDSHLNCTDFYLHQPELAGFHVNYIHSVYDPPVLQKITDTCSSRYFIYGCISNSAWADYAIILAKYPCVVLHKTFNEGDLYVFSRNSTSCINEYYFTSDNDFAAAGTGWINIKAANDGISDTALKIPVFRMDSYTEFSPTFHINLREISRHKNDIIDFCADIQTGERFTKAYVQVGIYSKEELLSFQSAAVDKTRAGETKRIYCSYRLADFDWRHHYLGVNAFVWNPEKQDMVIRGMSFRIRHGNPYLYGLYRKIER